MALVPLVKGNELRRSLRTSDRGDAIRRARILAVKADLLFERLKAMGKKDSDTLTSDLILQWNHPELGELKLDYDPTNPAELAEADRIRQDLLARVAPTNKKGAGEALSILVPRFLVEMKQTKAPATFGKFEHSLRLFLEITGDCGVYELGQARLAVFRDKLLCCPKHIGVMPETKGRPLAEIIGDDVQATIAPRTVNTHLRNVVAFSSWAHARDERVPKLTAEKLALPIDQRADEERKALDAKDLRLLFEGVRYKQLAEDEPHKCWLMLIALYTGARIEEISQLDLHSDVIEVDGMLVFDINALGDKRVKNKGSKRKVPISPKLTEMGLRRYLDAIRGHGHRRPFPQWKTSVDKKTGGIKHSKGASKWFGRYCDQLGITDPAKVFHSFRHTLLNHLKQAGVEEGKAAAIAGQTYGGITYTRYGKAYDPVDLCGIVKGIDFSIAPAHPALPRLVLSGAESV